MATLLYNHQNLDDMIEPSKKPTENDPVTEFALTVANVERDEKYVTVYFDPCGFYFVLSLAEYEKLLHPTDVSK